MFDPASFVSPLRIVMSPVHHTALLIPLIHTMNLYMISWLEVLHPWRKIDVMGDQQGTSGLDVDDKALMSATLAIVGQHPLHPTLESQLQICGTIEKSLLNLILGSASLRLDSGRRIMLTG